MSALAKDAHLWARSDLAFDVTRALEIGDAGEHIVCADLLLAGYRAFQAAQGAPYDVVVDLAGRLVRITVKSTVGPRGRPGRAGSKECYQFAVGRRKRDNKGKCSARAYEVCDVDIVALVALDLRRVCYLALRCCPTMLQFEAPHGAARTTEYGPKTRSLRQMSDYSFDCAVADLNGGSDAKV